METNWFYKQLLDRGIEPAAADIIALSVTIVLVLLGVIIATVIVRRSLLSICLGWVEKNRSRWRDPLLNNAVINKLSWFLPIIILHLLLTALLAEDSSTYLFFERVVKVFFVLVSVFAINGILSTVNDVYRLLNTRRADVLQGFIDAGKIVFYVIGIISIISILSGMSPLGILSVLGGLTAVTMLVFKDTILGFVASIQLSTMDMVRLGDWVEMPDYGADGDVIRISIHTIKVQNWDKTITTIPTYALVSNSFKNWRGMTESGGRRIKRALMIDVNSIRFCDEALLGRLAASPLLSGYLAEKEREIDSYNRSRDIDAGGLPINGRRQTNIGVFRAYVVAYLKNNPAINQDMTFMVRQLAPTEHGLPLEVYVFSKDKRWVFYEGIQADIFDHLFAALPVFDLRPFQSPSGYDLRRLAGGEKT